VCTARVEANISDSIESMLIKQEPVAFDEIETSHHRRLVTVSVSFASGHNLKYIWP